MLRALSPARRAVIGPPGWRFFSFWLALAITNLGTWAGVVALQLQILDLTGDQAYVSAVVVAEYLPAVILGTVLGHLLDRVPPRNGLAACELLAAAAWALMVTTGAPGTIVALALICGVTTGIFKIVSTAVVPMLVDDDDLDAANGAILSAQTLTNVAGVALGGVLVGLTSAKLVLVLNAFTFVISGALLLAFSRVPRRAAVARRASQRQPRLARALVGARRCLRDARAAHGHLQPAGRVGGARHRDRGGRADAARHLRRLELPDRRIMALDALGIAIGTTLPGARGLSAGLARWRSAGAASASRPTSGGGAALDPRRDRHAS